MRVGGTCRWLVGISYRVMFRRDPVPTVAPSVLKHVHGAIFLSGSDTMQPGLQPRSAVANGDMGDHTLPGYSGALYGTCKLQLDRQQSMGECYRRCLCAYAPFALVPLCSYAPWGI